MWTPKKAQGTIWTRINSIVYLACFPCLQILPEESQYFPFLTTSLFLCRDPLWIAKKKKKKKDPIKEQPQEKKCSTPIMHHSLFGEFWLDDSSVFFKADSFWLADGSVFVEGDSVLFRSSPVFSSELALPSSLSAAFSGAGSALEVCWGGWGGKQTRQGNSRRKRKVGRGQRGELKGVQVWQKSPLRRMGAVEVWWTMRRRTRQ